MPKHRAKPALLLYTALLAAKSSAFPNYHQYQYMYNDDYRDDNRDYQYSYHEDDDRLGIAQNYHFNKVDLKGCEQHMFHEPILSRAARCAKYPDSIRKLLAQPAVFKTLNEKSDYYMTTPLHVAAKFQTNNPYVIVKELILSGANVTSKADKLERTPVICAGENAEGGDQTLRALLEDYSRYRQYQKLYQKSRALSEEELRKLELTLNGGPDQDRDRSDEGDTTRKRVKINPRDTQATDPESQALQSGFEIINADDLKNKKDQHYYEVQRQLLASDVNGDNIMHVAAEKRNYLVTLYIKSNYPDILRLLVAAKNRQNKTAFDIAFEQRDRNMMKVLYDVTTFKEVGVRSTLFLKTNFLYVPEIFIGLLIFIVLVIVLYFTGFFQSRYIADTRSEAGRGLLQSRDTSTMPSMPSSMNSSNQKISKSPKSASNSSQVTISGTASEGSPIISGAVNRGPVRGYHPGSMVVKVSEAEPAQVKV